MRLIDADAINFEEVFGGQSDFAKDTRDAAQGLIDRQPTAFDKEKVIEHMIGEHVKAINVYNSSKGTACEFTAEARKNTWEKAIEITERGRLE